MLHINFISDILYLKEGGYDMEIKRIEVEGFRNLKKIKLELNDFNSIVSLNNYGKSNLLDGIEFGIEFIRAINETKFRMMNKTGDVPNNRNMDRDVFFFLIELSDNDKTIEYSYTFEWANENNNKEGYITDEILRYKENRKGQKYNTFLHRTPNSSTYQTSKTGRSNKNIIIENNALVVNKLEAYDSLFYLDVVKEINELKFCINRSFDASNSFEAFPFQRLNMSIYDIQTLENLPKILYSMKVEYPHKYELLINTFIDLFPNVELVTVRELLHKTQFDTELPEGFPLKISEKLYVLFVKETFSESAMEFSNLSDGAKRIFLLLLYIMLAEINKIHLIALEEVENSIHPGLFNKFVNILSQLVSDDLKLIISSHSPYILQYMELRDIFIGIPNKKGIADFRKIKKVNSNKILKMAADYDVTVGDYIFEAMNGSEDEVKDLISMMEVD